jgi:tetratricopeptide (TPR) repeat protein
LAIASDSGAVRTRLAVPKGFPVMTIGADEALCDRVSILARAEWVIVAGPMALGHPGWMYDLLAARQDGIAAVPRSPNVSGPQRVITTPYDDLASQEGRRQFVLANRESFSGIVESTRFVSELAALIPGDWFEDPDIYAVSGGRLLKRLLRTKPVNVAYQSILFSTEVLDNLIPVGHQGAPLVSLCMIVKDEEDSLSRAVDSARAVADELVIVDTGSKDRTYQLAKSLGAKVARCEWKNDFAWARNRALELCSGKWILWLDADEELVGETSVLRARLEDPMASQEGYSVAIRSMYGAGLRYGEHRATRLFRRANCCWRGAIHETIWYRNLRRPVFTTAIDEIRIEHFGYLDKVMSERGKAERNIQASAVNTGASSPVEAACHEARSLFLAGKYQRALELIENRVIGKGEVTFDRLGFLVGIDSARLLGKREKAWQLLEEFEQVPCHQAFKWEKRAQLLFEEGRFEEALEAADQIKEKIFEDDGFSIDPLGLVSLKAISLAELGRVSEAVSLVLEALASDGVLDIHLAQLIEWMDRANTGYAVLATALPESKKKLVVAQLLQMNPEKADAVLEELWSSSPDDRVFLAAASLVAKRLDLERAGVWSARLVEAGLGGASPLVAIANEEGAADRRREASRLARSQGLGDYLTGGRTKSQADSEVSSSRTVDRSISVLPR